MTEAINAPIEEILDKDLRRFLGILPKLGPGDYTFRSEPFEGGRCSVHYTRPLADDPTRYQLLILIYTGGTPEPGVVSRMILLIAEWGSRNLGLNVAPSYSPSDSFSFVFMGQDVLRVLSHIEETS